MNLKSILRIKPKIKASSPWELKDACNDGLASLIKDCLLYKEEILEKGPHLPFPQQSCCFSYKLKEDPEKVLTLPVGLLFHLWDYANEFRGVCPTCGGRIYGYSYGGMLSFGGIKGICIDCGHEAMLKLGGLGKVSDLIRKYLPDTPYVGHIMWFGGAAPDEGNELKMMLMNARYRIIY